MRTFLKLVKKYEFWRLVVDPKSFTYSCDNVSYVIKLIHSNEAVLHVIAVPPTISIEEADEEGKPKKPFVFDFNSDVWKILIKRYNIQESAIAAHN